MKKIDFTRPGGFPLQQKTLKFLQDAQEELLQAVIKWTSASGVFQISDGAGRILTGLNTVSKPSGAEVTEGWIIREGELLFFSGDTLENVENAGGIGIMEVQESATFNNGNVEDVYVQKFAIAGGENPLALNSYTRVINLSDVRPTLARSLHREIGVLAAGSKMSLTFNIPGAVVGDVVIVSLEDANPSGSSDVYGITDYVAVRARADVNDQVTVVLINQHALSPALGGMIAFRFRILK